MGKNKKPRLPPRLGFTVKVLQCSLPIGTSRPPRRPWKASRDAKLKYFQHSGALMTADGSDDELIQLEGVPMDYRLGIPK